MADTDRTRHLFYGSYYGGIWTQPLTADGRAVTGAARMVAIDNKFEGAYVIRRHGWWYLFASTANCCAGPTTGYSVQVGRSRAIDGPYVDRDGVALVASRAGGTPSIYQNGNRWIGVGHNAVITDASGQDWALYHAIDRADPYLDGHEGINERPMLLDRLDWVDGWPLLRGGRGPSQAPQAAPGVGVDGVDGGGGDDDGGDDGGGPASWAWPVGRPAGVLDRTRSDEFSGERLSKRWTSVRSPDVDLARGHLTWPVETADLVGAGNNASLLLQDAPPEGAWTVQTKLTIDLGVEDVRNFQQGGLIAYLDDDSFTRLSHVAIWNTRQSEFGKEMPWATPTNPNGLSFGGTIVGPPAAATWLRISARPDPHHDEVELTPFTSRDGVHWVRGGTWTLPDSAGLRIGLIAHGRSTDASQAGEPATARFDYFRVWRKDH